jgi:hypothetical protein
MTNRQHEACHRRFSQYFIGGMMPESANPVQAPDDH